MLNRTIEPATHAIEHISYLEPERFRLSNGIPVYGINAGSQELVKIEFVFEAGTWYQPANLVAGLANAFLNEGSQNYSAAQIAETFDARGAYLHLTADQQWAEVSILTLNKFVDDILEITADLMLHPTFPEQEVKVQIEKRKHRYLIENDKVKTLAQKKLSQVIFGETHPYANSNSLPDYDALTIDQLVEFHAKQYRPERCKIMVSGRYDETLYAKLDFFFGELVWPHHEKTDEPRHQVQGDTQKVHYIEKAGAIQSAIRMGCEMPNRLHPDFNGLVVLTTILGGYFGSRLMANIREDKGYTYGIGAGLMSNYHACYLMIGSEVGSNVCQAALNEIYFEIKRLQTELVSEDELNLVRNYLLGEMLRSFDGIFAISNSVKTLIDFNLDFSHYDQYIDEVRTIRAERLRELAKTYLKRERLYEVVAGPVK